MKNKVLWIEGKGKSYSENECIITINKSRIYGTDKVNEKILEINLPKMLIGFLGEKLILKPCSDDEVNAYKLSKEKGRTKRIIYINLNIQKALEINNVEQGKYPVIYNDKEKWFEVDIKNKLN